MPNFAVVFSGPGDSDAETVSVEIDGHPDDITDDQIEEVAREQLAREVDDEDDWDVDIIERTD